MLTCAYQPQSACIYTSITSHAKIKYFETTLCVVFHIPALDIAMDTAVSMNVGDAFSNGVYR